MFPVIELELDKPTPTPLSPIVALFKHALGVLWYATQQPDQVCHLQPELGHCDLTVVGGRCGPNCTELFVLAPVPPLTALETLVAQRLRQERRMTILYHNILLTYGSIGRIRLVSPMISPISPERRTCNWRTYEVLCHLDDRTAHRRDLSMLRAFA
jgi:hypothetical protein